MLNADTIHQRNHNRSLQADNVNPEMLLVARLLEKVTSIAGCLGSGLIDAWEQERLVRALEQANDLLATALDGSE